MQKTLKLISLCNYPLKSGSKGSHSCCQSLSEIFWFRFRSYIIISIADTTLSLENNHRHRKGHITKHNCTLLTWNVYGDKVGWSGSCTSISLEGRERPDTVFWCSDLVMALHQTEFSHYIPEGHDMPRRLLALRKHWLPYFLKCREILFWIAAERECLLAYDCSLCGVFKCPEQVWPTFSSPQLLSRRLCL